MNEVALHQPVLMREALDGLALRHDGWYVDATYGRGGHSAEILARLGAQGRLLALDKDPEAVAHARERFGAEPRFELAHAGFEDLAGVAGPWLGGRPLAGILFDLGVSSPQLDQPARGFSFAADGPLDMRMNTSEGQTAADWLAAASHGEIVRVLRDYGEEPRARQLASAIVRARAAAPLTSTRQLAELIGAHAGRGKRRIHPATLAFQAIRIAINDELGALERGLAAALELLGGGGRLVAISFHSLEDRVVKRFMAREARGDEAYAGLPNIPPEARPRLKLVGKLVRPADDEVARNPRARSARLRVAERLEVAA
ncbi:MAG TPA: 16S rRNA (cytosine(1402)-N(4))-methyltransferase RsmH [Gammaproteobacteria bacterium]|nr:16S rRNA (cytosine(1402)-N(4))-methyltransferase RsmH [Gammaproteobacteria bacterium]